MTTEDPLFALFGGYHDVMNDGSLILLPTPVSLLMRIEGSSPVLLIGDLAYEAESLMKNQVPGTGEKAQLLASYAKMRGLKQRLPDLVFLPSHDFAAHEALFAQDLVTLLIGYLGLLEDGFEPPAVQLLIIGDNRSAAGCMVFHFDMASTLRNLDGSYLGIPGIPYLFRLLRLAARLFGLKAHAEYYLQAINECLFTQRAAGTRIESR